MTFALPCGVFSSRISEGTSRASWLNDRTMAITLGARESYTQQKFTKHYYKLYIHTFMNIDNKTRFGIKLCTSTLILTPILTNVSACTLKIQYYNTSKS